MTILKTLIVYKIILSYNLIGDIMKIKNYINIALIIIWMLVIFSFSHQQGNQSEGLSTKLIIKIAETIKKDDLTEQEKENIVKKYQLITRKMAHITAYFILGILTITLFIDLYGFNYKTVIITLTICFLYACSDEIHQLFINGRNGSFIDILIDTTGAILAILLTKITVYLKNVHKKQNKNT